MRIVLSILLVLHGCLHFLGFTKAFAIGNIAQFTKEFSKPVGLLWLMAGLVFTTSGLLVLYKKEEWALTAILAVVVSQVLIFTVWADAKYGTVANIVILIAAIIAFASERFEKNYKKEVFSAMKNMVVVDQLITEKDLESLPPVVKKYLRYVGVVNKPKIYNVRIVFDGEMRERGKHWFKFTSEQYNFFQWPSRLFFMKARIKGLPTYGYHRYITEGASMRIELLSLFPVVHIDSPELFPTETVTFFNDLCLFAPAALIDERITWEERDTLSVRATFTTHNTAISATLSFNETGQLVNFVSSDRKSVAEMKIYPFSTPTSNYKNLNGYNLPTYGEAVWHYDDGAFVYGKFNVKKIEYNVLNPYLKGKRK